MSTNTGDILKTLRVEKNLTQDDIANLLNLKRQTYSAWERNISNPDIDTINFLADYYGVSTDYMLGRTNVRNSEIEMEELNKLAYKEIYSVEDALEIIESQEGLMLKGEMLTDEDKLLLANALQLGMKYVLDKKQKEKE